MRKNLKDIHKFVDSDHSEATRNSQFAVSARFVVLLVARLYVGLKKFDDVFG